MKIIAGKYKKQQIISQESKTTRPILTRIRENLFNILNNYFYYENKVALDLFAGSGSIGIEALSRDIKFCYFNDYDKNSLNYLQKNLQKLKVDSNNYTITNLDFLQCLNRLKIQQNQLDLVFLNPPYKHINYYHEAVSFLIKHKLLNNYGIIICETNRVLDIKNSEIELLTMRKYGKIFLYFYRYEERK